MSALSVFFCLLQEPLLAGLTQSISVVHFQCCVSLTIMVYHNEIIQMADVKTNENNYMTAFLRNKSKVAGELKIQPFFILP